MPVGNEDCPDAVAILSQVGDIGQNQVDAGLFFVRECDTAIDDDDVVLILEHKHIFANFGDTAEKNQFRALRRSDSFFLSRLEPLGAG